MIGETLHGTKSLGPTPSDSGFLLLAVGVIALTRCGMILERPPGLGEYRSYEVTLPWYWPKAGVCITGDSLGRVAYLNFDLQFTRSGADYQVQVVGSPAGDGQFVSFSTPPTS